MRSNCLIEALRVHRRRLREWVAAGRPKGQEPYWVIRPSRHAPRWIRHRLVGHWKDCPHCGGGIHVESFKPDNPKDVPWWKLPQRLFYVGRWTVGD